MSETIPPARPYHHGDLRRALIEAAVEILRAEGNADFTLRELARRAGVSHAAPYKHFADKGELLGEVAALGYSALAEAMRGAAAGEDDPVEALVAIGAAYVGFGVRNPAHFRLMFAPMATERRSPVARTAAGGAWEVLAGAIGRCAEAGMLRPGDPRDHALAAWSMVHGLATLTIDNLARFPADDVASAERAAAFAVRGLVSGMCYPPTP